MSMHRCDPSDADTPLTKVRLLRAIAAAAKRDEAAIIALTGELGSCPDCARRMTWGAAGWAAKLIADHQPDMLMAIELQIAAAEAAARRGGSAG